jgi:hypothetical protein
VVVVLLKVLVVMYTNENVKARENECVIRSNIVIRVIKISVCETMVGSRKRSGTQGHLNLQRSTYDGKFYFDGINISSTVLSERRAYL